MYALQFHGDYYFNNRAQRERGEGSSRLKHMESNRCGDPIRREYNLYESI